jgi:general secretion pathway protein C
VIVATPLLALALAAASAPADLTAVGIVLSPQPERSVALVRSANRTRVVGIGDSAFGGRVVVIAAGSVSLEFPDGRLELRLGPVAAASPPRPAPRPALPAEDPETPPRSMARVEVQRRLNLEIPRILADTAVAPVMEDGAVKGLAVTRVAQGTLLSDAGLRAGDVLTSINDVAIDGLPTLMGLWPRLQNETELRAVVVRGGRPVLLSVTLR